MKFVDEARIQVKAGDGGRGCVAFLREKYRPKGGPAGGDGGRGGDVLLRADQGRVTLLDFRFQSRIAGGRGEHGRGKSQHGRSAKPVVVPVPTGTLVRDVQSGELLADLAQHGAEVVVARGGRGGRGNARFVTSTNRAPREAEEGQPGQERELILELRLLAEVGIIGLPNVGKSTFISAISAARPRVAAYPFTTLVPTLGVAKVDESDLVFADIPGLIEGAHRGAGLGTRFLRHISRTAVLVHLLDLSQPHRDPEADFATVNNEIGAFDQALARRHQIVVANKFDLEETRRRYGEVGEAFASRGIRLLPMSAVTGEGVATVLRAALELARAGRERAQMKTSEGSSH